MKLAASRDTKTQVIGVRIIMPGCRQEGHDPRLAPGFEMPEDLKVYPTRAKLIRYNMRKAREMLPDIYRRQLLDNPEDKEVKKMADISQ